MRSVTISTAHENKKVGKVIRELFTKLPSGAMYKAFRKKDIRVNGIRVKEDFTVSAGDKLDIYISDEILDGIPIKVEAGLIRGFEVVYEDKNILIVNKEQGIPVHPDREQLENTLIDQVRYYLEQSGEYNPKDESSFPPSLCHRLDRNTGGLIIIAKNSDSLKILLDKIKRREIRKYYQCLVQGSLENKSGELKAYLSKDPVKSRVFIKDSKSRGSVQIITRYKVLSYKNGISKLEIELVTGRTHQIRAHLAHIGHPIVGDGKYGSNSFNRSLGMKRQALWAYKIFFEFSHAGILSYLGRKTFEIEPRFDDV